MTDTQIESQKPTQSRSERGRHQVGSPHPILNFPNPFSSQSQGLSSNGKSGHVPAIWLPGMKSSAGQRVGGAGVTPACRLHLLPPQPSPPPTTPAWVFEHLLPGRFRTPPSTPMHPPELGSCGILSEKPP